MQLDRRHAFAGIAGLALVPLAACVPGRTVPIPGDSDAVFADIESLIASTEAMVNFVVSLGIVGPETIAGARALIAKARGYVADAEAAIEDGGWKPLIDLAWQTLTGIVFSGLMGVAEAGKPALTMTIRK